MRQLTPKRLSAWLLTLIMLMGMLPAMASADEVDEDLSPPAPQEDYGYVRLVFSEGEQLDLHHGEYITECSPTAEVFGNASEDFITDGEYAALYYEGRLYHKAALDGVSIDADAVLPAEDFALVPMGKLAAQEPPSGAEPEAPTTGGTTEGTTEGTTGGTTEGTNEGTNGGTTGGSTEGTTEETTGGSTEGTTEQQETLPPLAPPAMKAPLRAGAEPDNTYGMVVLNFPKVNNESRAIKLYSGQYITECDPGANVWSGTPNNQSDYLVWYHEGILYLNGDLQDVRINLRNADRFPNESKPSVLVYVKDNVTMSGCDTLLDLQDGINATLHIDPGKRLTLNLTRNAQSTTRGAAIYGAGGSNLTVIGGGELHINAYGSGDKSGAYTYTFGIALRGDLTLSSGIYSAGSPDVQIKVSNDSTNTESDKVFGVDVHGLTVKDESFLKIDVTGRALDPKTEGDSSAEGAILGRVNGAISAGSMKLLDKASVDITSHKNVVSDIALTGGEVLMVDTEGYFHITNYGNITRYPDDDDHKHKLFDHPDANIYLPNKEATANIVRVEEGMVIDSYSRIVDRWYDEVINGTEQWNWVIGRGTRHGGGIGIEPTLGTDMYVGTRRVGEAVKVSDSDYRYTWGKYEYIYSTTGVATVKQSSGLIMRWEKPSGAASSDHYARVIEPGFNNIHVVHKGADLSLEAPEGKGTFLYWYDALHPEGSENGTSWKSAAQTFSNIQQDMVLVPVRDPMKNGPTLSDVGYSVQWDKGATKQTRYAYQDLTFEKENGISTSGGYRVMLVPAQLPRYGENTYAVNDLKNRPVMEMRNSRLYADKNAYGTDGAMNGSFWNIPTGSYRIACNDDATNKCFFSKPFTFDPPVAPPYISPGSGISENSSSAPDTVTITAEREANIWYSLWDYAKNQWGTLNSYTDPFDVNVTTAQDVRIKAYAGPIIKEITSEVRYALRPTDKPTVKHGETVVSDGNRRYFYGSIDLTVEAPEGYEVWYRVDYQPSESEMGTKVMEGGKVTITDSGSHGIIYFKLAKAFTVDGVPYRKLSHNYTSVHLSKLDTLPAPKVTVTTKEGNQTLIPDGNTYTMTEDVVTVTLEPNGNWPLDATIAYDTNGNATPRLSTSYTTPFDVRGAGTLAVFTLVPKADGGYDFKRTAYTFKLAESLQTVPVSTYGGNCTAYYLDENGKWVSFQANNVLGYRLKVGTKVKIVPNPPSGQVFKKWKISNYEEWHIWGAYGAGDYHNPELIFHVPKPQYSSYGSEPKTLSIEATFGTAAEANISGQTLVGLVMKETVGDSISLWDTSKEMRTISCQWWEGSSAGTEEEALLSWVTFEPDKTYTVQVTIKANPGASFASSAGVAIGHYGGHFTVPNGKITRTKDTLTFTATPIRQIDLTMPAPLTVGDPLPTIEDVKGLPAGVTAQKLEWPNAPDGTVPETETGMVRAALTLKTDGTRPILVREYPNPTVNGEQHMYTRDSSSHEEVTDGSTVMLGGIDLPVKSKGVKVSGTITSYGSDSDDVTVQLIEVGHTEPAYETPVTGTSAAYSFETVPAGNYTLKVMKKGHAPFTKEITVGDSNVTENVTIYLIGDVNRDGNVDLYDLLTLQQYLAKNITLTETQLLISDVTKDDKVDLYDLLTLQQYLARNITSFD